MTPSEYKRELHEALWPRHVAMLNDYLERVELEGSLEDKRKANELVMKLLGSEVERKQNANTGTVVQINFGTAGVSVEATQQPAFVEEVVEPEPEAPLQLEKATPSPLLVQASQDDELMKDLAGLLDG